MTFLRPMEELSFLGQKPSSRSEEMGILRNTKTRYDYLDRTCWDFNRQQHCIGNFDELWEAEY
jgi:hypothetical protein